MTRDLIIRYILEDFIFKHIISIIIDYDFYFTGDNSKILSDASIFENTKLKSTGNGKLIYTSKDGTCFILDNHYSKTILDSHIIPMDEKFTLPVFNEKINLFVFDDNTIMYNQSIKKNKTVLNNYSPNNQENYKCKTVLSIYSPNNQGNYENKCKTIKIPGNVKTIIKLFDGTYCIVTNEIHIYTLENKIKQYIKATNEIHIWDLENKIKQYSILENTEILSIVEFNNGVNYQLAITIKNGPPIIWDLITKSFKNILDYTTHAEKIYKLNENKILLYSKDDLCVWDYHHNTTVILKHTNIEKHILILNDGKILCASRHQTGKTNSNGDEFYISSLLLLDPDTLNILSETNIEKAITRMELFYDNKIIIVCHDIKLYDTLNIWNPITRKCEMSLPILCYPDTIVLFNKKIAILGAGTNHDYIQIIS